MRKKIVSLLGVEKSKKVKIVAKIRTHQKDEINLLYNKLFNLDGIYLSQ
jgi:hypothetical protein